MKVERGRVIIALIPPDKFAKVEKRMKRRANRSPVSKTKTLEANRYQCLFCSDGSLSVEDAIARYRWQIERLFKRLKSLQKLDKMTVKSQTLIRLYLLCHALLALLAQRLQQVMLFLPDVA